MSDRDTTESMASKKTRHQKQDDDNKTVDDYLDESSTLLSSAANSKRYDDDDDDSGKISGSKAATRSHIEHAKWIIHKSIPLLVTTLLHQVVKWIVIITAGRLGSVELGSIALAHVFENLSSKLTAWSFRSALGTLCSQAWTGAKDKSLVGLYLQRAYVLFGLISIPFGCIWAGSGIIFDWLRQDPEIARSTQTYLMYQIPGFLAHAGYVLLMAYLQAQGVMRATVYALTLALPFHILFNYVLVYYAGLGIVGVSIALSLNYIMTWGFLALYSAKIDGYQGWGGWSRECFQEWGAVMHLFLPASIGAIWTAVSEGVITFSVSYLGKDNLAAQSILLRSSLTMFAPGRSLRNSLGNRIGNELGGGSPNDAKRAYFVGALLALVVGVASTILLMACRKSYPYLLTSDDEVAAAVSEVIPVFAVSQIIDMFKSLGGGVLQGLGRQKVLALIGFFSDFVIAIPLCYLFTFHLNGGLVGLWAGLSCGYMVAALIQIGYIFLKIDWIVESKLAIRRIHQHQHAKTKATTTARQ
ncbi:mate-domain-containing protein [Zychaea mexicana]|uniref:mate-domain-containing protein n=1 Tax=Zychaea mexicana TaxID=64656 RepID=UPI0022FDF340|nr:mate-domain-containing protein [Zychaea mexicana]KAI9494267.1 mate-domain-containing protein [Zychaea mexicana]